MRREIPLWLAAIVIGLVLIVVVFVYKLWMTPPSPPPGAEKPAVPGMPVTARPPGG